MKSFASCVHCRKECTTEQKWEEHECKATAGGFANAGSQVFTCPDCRGHFATERGLEQHTCKKRERLNEAKSPRGRLAWEYYKWWCKCMHRAPTTLESFIWSKIYTTMINFVDHVRRVKLPMPEKFIEFAIREKFQPGMWCMDEVYTRYISYLDVGIDPKELIMQTVDQLYTIADQHGVDIAKVFEVVPIHLVIQSLQRRKLSPWLLLVSRQFQIMLRTRAAEDERRTISTMIPINVWKSRFEGKPESVSLAKKVVARLNL